jgi:two-component system sensor histidine kinase YesM
MMGLRKKVFLAFFAFIIFPLCLVGGIAYYTFQSLIEQKYTEQSEVTIKAVARNVTTLMKQADTFTEFWRYEDRVMSLLSDPNGLEDNSENRKILNLSFLSNSDVTYVAIYSLDGRMLSVGNDFNNNRKVGFQKLIEHPIFQDVLNNHGRSKWIGPYEHPDLTGKNSEFTIIRTMTDLLTMNPKGYVYIQMNLKELDKIFNMPLSKRPLQDRFLIINHQGVILRDSSNMIGGQNFNNYTVKPEKFDLNQSFLSSKTKFEGVESVVSVYNLESSGFPDWSLVSITPWDYISGETLNIMKWIAVITSLCLICALLFNLLYVNRYIRFIMRLVKSMKYAELGDLSVRVETRSKDETMNMARGFNSLVERVSNLIEEVKVEHERKNKAELMLLEAQIKPHFIFNTLESINALAIQNEGKKVSQLVYRLGSILRIFEQKEMIPISMEMDHLTSYLEIQKYRFEELFEYDLLVPKHLEGFLVIKLTLQPLVENAIQHGFEGIDYYGNIIVRIEEKDDDIILWVEDNGIGMTNDILERFYELRQAGLHNRQSGNGDRVGLGIMNVADRISIHFGPRYGMQICSHRGHGTIIRCIIPKMMTDKVEGGPSEFISVIGR